MAGHTNNMRARNTERFFLLILSTVMIVLFYQLYQVLQGEFPDVAKRLGDGTMMNLNDEKPGEHIKTLLRKGFYFKDPKDIDLIGKAVANGRRANKEVIDNVGELNKSSYYVNTDEAWTKGGEVFKKRVQVERSLLGFTDADSVLFQKEKTKPQSLPSVNNLGLGKGTITGLIKKDEN